MKMFIYHAFCPLQHFEGFLVVKNDSKIDTYQLCLSEVFLPPEILAHRRDDRQSIVRIHKHMDKAIQSGSKEA